MPWRKITISPFVFIRSLGGDVGGVRTVLEGTVSTKNDEIKSMEQRKKDVASRSRCVNVTCRVE